MRPTWPQIDWANLGDTVDAIKTGFIKPAARAMNDLRNLLNNGLLLGEHVNGAWVEFDATHAIESRLVNPLKNVPRVFWPERAMILTGSGTTLRETGVQDIILSHPVLNTQRSDGFLGITVQLNSGALARVRGFLVGG